MNGSGRLYPRRQRLELVYQCLSLRAPAANHDSALEMLAVTLNGVEDVYSGVPYNLENPSSDGRMYPPNMKYRYSAWERPGIRCYRQTAHATFIADNGAVEIRERQGNDLGAVTFEKAGQDGRKVSDYDSVG